MTLRQKLFAWILGSMALAAAALFLFTATAMAQAAAEVAAAAPAPDFWATFMQQYAPPLMMAIIGLLGALAVWIKSPTAKLIRAKVKNDAAASVGIWVSNLVFEYVGRASQTLVKGWKRDFADGVLTKREYSARLKGLKDTMIQDLLDIALGRLQDSGEVAAGAAGIDAAREMLDRKIEALLPGVKATLAAAPKTAAPDPSTASASA